MVEPLRPVYNFCEKLTAFYELTRNNRVGGTEKAQFPAGASKNLEDQENQGQCLSKDYCPLGNLCTGIITLLFIQGQSSLFKPTQDFALPTPQKQSSAPSC